MFRTTNLTRVIVATAELDQAAATFQKNFGFNVAARGVGTLAGAQSVRLDVGNADIEFAAPEPGGSPLEAFLTERGPGLYLLVLEVDDLEAAAAVLADKGIEFSRTTTADGRPALLPSPAATHGARIALVSGS